MEIRRPNETEFNEILLHSPKAVSDGTLGEAKPSMEKIKKLVEPLIEKGGYYLIAIEENQLMGWVLAGAATDQFTDKAVGFIYELFVLEEFRGAGLSKLLMNSAINELKTAGYSEVRLSTFSGNKAIKLYEDIGFTTRTVSMSKSI